MMREKPSERPSNILIRPTVESLTLDSLLRHSPSLGVYSVKRRFKLSSTNMTLIGVESFVMMSFVG